MIVTGAEPEDVFVSPETETGMNVSFTGYKILLRDYFPDGKNSEYSN
jgi:hypothetical protein